MKIVVALITHSHSNLKNTFNIVTRLADILPSSSEMQIFSSRQRIFFNEGRANSAAKRSE